MYKNSGPRQRILELLRRRGPATVQDLACEMGLVAITVRSHLSALADQGLVQSEAERGHVGRPRQRFRLTENGDAQFPKRHAAFAGEMIASLKTLAGKRGMDQVLDAAATRYAAAHAPLLHGRPLGEKVRQVADILDDESGMASCESSVGGFVIHDFNCPYAGLSEQYPEVCRYHLQVVSKLLEHEVSLEQSLARGDKQCLFLVNERSSQRPVGVHTVSDGRLAPGRRA